LSELSRKNILALPVMVHDDTPWTALSRPLSECRVALVTTAGLHVRGDRPFTGGEQGYRIIPSSTPARDILLSHTSIGFDRSGYMQDLNVVFPVDRTGDLLKSGEAGSLGPNNYAFLGAQRKWDGIVAESGPEVGRRLKEEGVDAVLLTGT
jgi:D-proline reductase (dithiol) PrdB